MPGTFLKSKGIAINLDNMKKNFCFILSNEIRSNKENNNNIISVDNYHSISHYNQFLMNVMPDAKKAVALHLAKIGCISNSAKKICTNGHY